MKILITGDREWTNDDVMAQVLYPYLQNPNDTILIHGDCRGADKLSEYVAKKFGLSDGNVRRYPADWDKYGKIAGPIRNFEMLRREKPDVVIAFHNHLTDGSKGTLDMVKKSLKVNVKEVLHVYETIDGYKIKKLNKYQVEFV